MKIAEIDRQISIAESSLRLRISQPSAAFPGLRGQGKLARLAMPTATLQALPRWLWLKWHQGAAHKSVLVKATLVIERSLAATREAHDDDMRPQHDVFALMAAILSGDAGLARKVAEASIEADPSSRKKQFYQAWAGMLKWRVLGQDDQVKKQLSVLQKDKGLGMFAEPSNALAEAFCERNHPGLEKEVKKTLRKCQSDAGSLGAIAEKDGQEPEFWLVRDNRVFRHRWPWPEAAFIKLAKWEGAGLALEDFWIPQGFIDDWWKK